MTLDSFENTIKELTRCIEQEMKHKYIEKYIDKPYIDEIKLVLLTKLFQYANLTKDIQKDCVVSTMLVQIASDTHELVPITNESTTQHAEKEKQLLVLAGDYYSGLHYLLLANIGDFSLIQSLAISVRKINELKMNLYYETDVDFDHIIAIQKQIHSLVTTNVMELYTDFDIQPFIEDIILMSHLIFEQHLVRRHQQVRLLNKISNELSHETLTIKLDQTIARQIARIENHLVNPMMQSTLNQLQFDKLFQRLMTKHCSFVEEG